MRPAVIAVVAVLLASAPPVVHPDAAVWESGIDGVAVADRAAGSDAAAGAANNDATSDRQWFVYYSVGWTGEAFCRQRHVTTDGDLAAAYNYALQRELAAANAPGTTALCPPNATAPPAAATPDQLARDFWTVRILPTPSLKIVPDYAITGKRVYLQIGGQRSQHFDVPDPLGPPVSIDATSEYVVDWGDGTVETTTSSGGPWPDGDVTHVYTTTAEARTITVNQRWSATWRAGAQQGALDNLRTDARLTFRVTQVLAVRG